MPFLALVPTAGQSVDSLNKAVTLFSEKSRIRLNSGMRTGQRRDTTIMY
jgi:hypothetical protein